MSGNEESFQQAMNQGHSAAWDQQWDRAAAYYRQALEEDPNNPKALTSLALALYELQDYQEALSFYQQAARATPDDPLPLEKVADLHERLGNLDQASEVFMRAAELYARNRDVNKAIENWSNIIRFNPEHLLAHSRLAMVYERLGRKPQAITEYLIIASLLQSSGDIGKAIQAAVHAAQISPDSSEAGQALVMLKEGQTLPKPSRPRGGTGPLLMAHVKRLETSQEPDQPASNLDPIGEARQQALTDLAGLLFEQNDEESEQSRQSMQTIIKGTGSLAMKTDQTRIMLHLSQAIDLQARGQNAPALDELQRALEAGLDHAAADYDVGMLMAEAGRLESALRYLGHSVKHARYGLGSHLLLGQIYKKMSRSREAAVEYLEALKDADGQMVPAEQAEELRQLYDPLIEDQNTQTVELQDRLSTNIDDLLKKAGWRENLKRARQQLPPQSAGSPPMPLAEMLTETRGGQIIEAMSRINQLARSGALRAAMEEAFYALQYAPTYLPLHTCMADLLLQEGRAQNAVEKFSCIAQTYSIRGESKRAIELYRRIIELSPMDLTVRNHLIDQLIALGKNDEAILEHMNLADVYYNLADLTNARRSYTQALRVAQQANVDRSLKVKILHRMADIYLQSLDWRQACRIFEQIRTLQPDDEQARNSLIELNFRLGQAAQAVMELDNYITFLLSTGKRDRAIQILQDMVNDNPKQAAVRRRLAELYRQAGKTEEAISEYDVAGELLMEGGDRTGAIECVRAIIALGPPNLRDYQTLLMQLQQAK